MKKKNLTSKLNFSKDTISNLSKVLGGDMTYPTENSCERCGSGGTGGGTTSPNTWYTHRPCDTAAYNPHCDPYNC